MLKCAFLQTDQNVKTKTRFSGRGCCSLRSAPSAFPLRGGPAGSFVLTPMDCILPLFRPPRFSAPQGRFFSYNSCSTRAAAVFLGLLCMAAFFFIARRAFCVSRMSCALCVSCVSDVCKTCVKCVWVVLRCVLRGRKDKFCNRKLRKRVKKTT